MGKNQLDDLELDESVLPICGLVDRASATEAVDSGSIPGRVKSKTMKFGIHSFPVWRSAVKGTV